MGEPRPRPARHRQRILRPRVLPRYELTVAPAEFAFTFVREETA
ncbi:hypothetical protein NKH77_45190 [Streptomyces sp. M19]